MKLFVFSSLVLAFSLQSIAQQQSQYFSNYSVEVFAALYDFQMLSADSLVNKEKTKNGVTPELSLLSANVAWSQILAGNLENDHWNDRFRNDIQQTKVLLRNEIQKDDKAMFYYIIANAFKTRHEMLFGNYFTAASNLNTCINLISDSFGREKDFEPLYLTSGLYYYFMAYAYDEYVLARPIILLYPKGDRVKGLHYLNKLANSQDLFLRNEANYFLLRIYLDIERDLIKAKPYADKLVEYAPDNLLYRYFSYKIAFDIGVIKEAELDRKKYLELLEINKQLGKDQHDFFKHLIEN